MLIVKNYRLADYNSKLYFETHKTNGGFYTNRIDLWDLTGCVCLGVEPSSQDYRESKAALDKITDTIKACKVFQDNIHSQDFNLTKFDKLMKSLRFKKYNTDLQVLVDILNQVIFSDKENSVGKGA